MGGPMKRYCLYVAAIFLALSAAPTFAADGIGYFFCTVTQGNAKILVTSRPAKYSYAPDPGAANASPEEMARYVMDDTDAFHAAQKTKTGQFFEQVKAHYGTPCDATDLKDRASSVAGPFQTEAEAAEDIESNASMKKLFLPMDGKEFRQETLDFE